MEVREVLVGGLVYKIDECGNIYKRRGKGFLKHWPDKDGYHRIVVPVKGTTVNKIVHRLVYEAFIGPIPEGMTVDHKDSNRTNNHYSNLQLMTFEENAIKGNAKNWKFVSPEGEVVEIYNLTAFCREHGLDKSHMAEVHHEKPQHYQHKGWRKHYEQVD